MQDGVVALPFDPEPEPPVPVMPEDEPAISQAQEHNIGESRKMLEAIINVVT